MENLADKKEKLKIVLSICPYCKQVIEEITSTRTKEEKEQHYNKHLETCKPYLENKEKMLKILRLKETDPRTFNALIDIWETEFIEEDLKKLMKKHKITKEKLSEILEDMEI